MRKLAARLLAGGALTLALVAGQPAHAQNQTAESLYGDLRGVIEELIRAEITGNVVAAVEARSPALGFYFQRTLERLASPYWGNLVATLEADLVAMGGDFIFWSITRPSGGDGFEARMEAFLGCYREGASGARCSAIQKLVASGKGTLVDRRCRSADAPASDGAEVEIACDLALAFRSGLERKTRIAMRHVIDSVTDVLLHDFAAGTEKRRLRQVAQAWLKKSSAFPAAFPDLFLSPELEAAALTRDAIAARCKEPEQLQQFFAAPAASAAWICFAVNHAGLLNTLAFRVTLAKRGGKPVEALLTPWRVLDLLEVLESGDDPRPREQQLYAMFLSAATAEHCARNNTLKRPAREPALGLPVLGGGRAGKRHARGGWLECRDWKVASKDAAGVEITAHWLGLEFPARIDDTGRFQPESPLALLRAMRSFEQGMTRIETMRASVPVELRDYLFLQEQGDPARSARVLVAFLRVGRFVSELRSRWYLWPSEEELVAEGRLAGVQLGGLLGLAFEITASSGGETGAAAQKLARIRQQLEDDVGVSIREVLDLAFRADKRELAVQSLRIALRLRKRDGALRASPYEAFFVSLAAYMLDDSGGDGSAVTREAFRAAARDLLIQAAPSGVPPAGQPFALRLSPMVSARISFNGQYLNEGGRDGMRYLVSADWPSILFAARDYVGVEASLFDPVAPLAELALRRVGDWDDQRRLLVDFIRPRAGLWFAVPQLSRRLTVTTGAGARFVGTEEESAGGDFRGRYVWRFSAEVHIAATLIL